VDLYCEPMNLRIFPSMLLTVSLLGPYCLVEPIMNPTGSSGNASPKRETPQPNTVSATFTKMAGVSRSTINPRPPGISAQLLKVTPMHNTTLASCI